MTLFSPQISCKRFYCIYEDVFRNLSIKPIQTQAVYLSAGTSWRPPPFPPAAAGSWGPGPVPRRRRPGRPHGAPGTEGQHPVGNMPAERGPERKHVSITIHFNETWKKVHFWITIADDFLQDCLKWFEQKTKHTKPTVGHRPMTGYFFAVCFTHRYVSMLIRCWGRWWERSLWLAVQLNESKNGTDKSKEGTHYRHLSLLSFEQWIILIITRCQWQLNRYNWKSYTNPSVMSKTGV